MLRSELDTQHASSMAYEKDIEKAREELSNAKRESTERLRALEEEALLSTQSAQLTAQQMEFLKSDILKFQATARAAHSNYERELQLHAKAESDLKNVETGTFFLVLTILTICLTLMWGSPLLLPYSYS